MHEEALKRGVRAERQNQAHSADEVPDAPTAGVFRTPPPRQGHQRDERKDPAVRVQLRQAVGPCVGLESDGAATEQVRHKRDEQLGRGDRARGDEDKAGMGPLRDRQELGCR